jgi:hypothetical protein
MCQWYFVRTRRIGLLLAIGYLDWLNKRGARVGSCRVQGFGWWRKTGFTECNLVNDPENPNFAPALAETSLCTVS